MFKNNQGTETKIAVLEERLLSYENMMKKIEEVIQVMTETSQNVSKMLAVHEERIEYHSKVDQLILDKIKTIEDRNLEESKKIIEKIESLEEKLDTEIKQLEVRIEDVSRIKWITVGTGLVLAVLVGAISSFSSGYISSIASQQPYHQVDK